jgi:hypothetical protein
VRYGYRGGPDYDADAASHNSQVPRIFAQPSHLGPNLPHAARQFLRRLDIVAESPTAAAFAPTDYFNDPEPLSSWVRFASPSPILIPSASQAGRWRRGIFWSQGLTAIAMLAATALSRLSKVQNWHRSMTAAASVRQLVERTKAQPALPITTCAVRRSVRPPWPEYRIT